MPKKLVYLSPVPWNSYDQRPHKFVYWFQRKFDAEVIWLDPYPTRFPSFSDLGRLSVESLVSKPTPSWLKVFKPISMPLEPIKGSFVINLMFWRKTLKLVKSFLSNPDEAVLVIGKPSALARVILKDNPECYSVYDRMDNFPAFYVGMAQRAMKDAERFIIGTVDDVLASSNQLADVDCDLNRRAQLIPNALDSGILAHSAIQKTRPVNPVFGYVGTIASWFDWEWVIKLALLYPESTVRLVGPNFSNVKKSLPDNIELCPECSHQEALRHVGSFDVGIIPFIINDLTKGVDPIKFYEYKALGKAVLSSNMPTLKDGRSLEGLYLCSKADLWNVSQEALAYVPRKSVVSQFIIENTWDRRFDSINWELSHMSKISQQPYL